MSYQRTGNPVGMKYTGKSAKKIKELRTKNPLMNLVEIGEELGVSKQYVHKILKKLDLHTGVPKKKKFRRCIVCKENFVGKKGQLWSTTCSIKFYHVPVTCSFCHVQFTRKRSAIMQRHREGYKRIYCSRACTHRGRKDYIRGKGSRFHDYQR